MYIDAILESTQDATDLMPCIDHIIEEAVYQACIEGGEDTIKIFEQYVDALEKNIEIDVEIEQSLSESFFPYVDHIASFYVGVFESITPGFMKTAEDKLADREKQSRPTMMSKLRSGYSNLKNRISSGVNRAKQAINSGAISKKMAALKSGMGAKFQSMKTGAQSRLKASKQMRKPIRS